MLKAIVSYSKKIPAETEFSSQGYSLSLETEIAETDAKAIQARLHGTFELVKAAVEMELANGKTKAVPLTDVPENRVELPSANTGKASNKQVKFITDLASQQHISISELNARVKELYGVDNIYDLNRKDASRLVDSLKTGSRRKAA